MEINLGSYCYYVHAVPQRLILPFICKEVTWLKMLASSVSQTSLQPASAAGVDNSNWLLMKELSMTLYPLHYELASKIILPSTEEFISPVSVGLDHQNLQPMSITSHTKFHVSPNKSQKSFPNENKHM